MRSSSVGDAYGLPITASCTSRNPVSMTSCQMDEQARLSSLEDEVARLKQERERLMDKMRHISQIPTDSGHPPSVESHKPHLSKQQGVSSIKEHRVKFAVDYDQDVMSSSRAFNRCFSSGSTNPETHQSCGGSQLPSSISAHHLSNYPPACSGQFCTSAMISARHSSTHIHPNMAASRPQSTRNRLTSESGSSLLMHEMSANPNTSAMMSKCSDLSTPTRDRYQMSQDLEDLQIKILERKYGGATIAQRSARIIQAAYRDYAMQRNFTRLKQCTQSCLMQSSRLTLLSAASSIADLDRPTSTLTELKPSGFSACKELNEDIDTVLEQAYCDWEKIEDHHTQVTPNPALTRLSSLRMSKDSASWQCENSLENENATSRTGRGGLPSVPVPCMSLFTRSNSNNTDMPPPPLPRRQNSSQCQRHQQSVINSAPDKKQGSSESSILCAASNASAWPGQNGARDSGVSSTSSSGIGAELATPGSSSSGSSGYAVNIGLPPPVPPHANQRNRSASAHKNQGVLLDDVIMTTSHDSGVDADCTPGLGFNQMPHPLRPTHSTIGGQELKASSGASVPVVKELRSMSVCQYASSTESTPSTTPSSSSSRRCVSSVSADSSSSTAGIISLKELGSQSSLTSSTTTSSEASCTGPSNHHPQCTTKCLVTTTGGVPPSVWIKKDDSPGPVTIIPANNSSAYRSMRQQSDGGPRSCGDLSEHQSCHCGVSERFKITTDMRKKRIYRIGLNLFNKKAEKGLQFLMRNGFLEDSAQHIARFLMTRKGLSRQMIGEYLGDTLNEMNQRVLHYFANDISLRGLEIDEAMRRFFSYFRLPGESQKIGHILEIFAAHYLNCQADLQKYCVQSPADKVRMVDSLYILAYAVVMLNTDLHNSNVKKEKKMKLEQFVKNLRGVNGGHDFDPSLLTRIYQRVKDQPFMPAPDHTTQVRRIAENLLPGPGLSSIGDLVQPHRRMVCFCRMQEIQDVNRKMKPGERSREVFLFNDLLLVTKAQSRKSKMTRSITKISSSSTSQQPNTTQNSATSLSTTLNNPSKDSSSIHKSSHSGHVSSSSLASTNSTNSSQGSAGSTPTPGGASSASSTPGVITQYASKHVYSLVGVNATLVSSTLYPNAIQLKRGIDSSVLLTLCAKTCSDRQRFFEDIQECILEMSEMESMRIEEELIKQQRGTTTNPPLTNSGCKTPHSDQSQQMYTALRSLGQLSPFTYHHPHHHHHLHQQQGPYKGYHIDDVFMDDSKSRGFGAAVSSHSHHFISSVAKDCRMKHSTTINNITSISKGVDLAADQHRNSGDSGLLMDL